MAATGVLNWRDTVPRKPGSTRLTAIPYTILAVITMPAPVLAIADSAMDKAITLPQPPPPMAWAT